MRVCSAHFANEDFLWNTIDPNVWTPTLKRLKQGTMPSLRLPVRVHDRPAPMPRSQRCDRTPGSASGLPSCSSGANETAETQPSSPRAEVVHSAVTGETCAEEGLAADNGRHHHVDDELTVARALLILQGGGPLQTKDESTQVDTRSLVRKRETLDNLLKTDGEVKAFTGVESIQLLQRISKNVQRFDTMNTELSVHERVMLVLVRLKTFLSFKCIGTLFRVSEATVHRYFYGTLPTLAAVLKSAIYWPTKGEIEKNIPHCFRDYCEVRVVLDCTEVEIEKSHCLACRLFTYSYYKGRHTVKFLIGVSPAGLITFVSQGFGGRASDKACVERSLVLSRLQPFRDDVMVDKGFHVDAECNKLGLGVVQPPFLRQQQQFSVADAMKTVSVAQARVHVERAIQRIKVFKIFKGPIPWEMLKVADHAITVVAAIVNLSAPILSENKFG
ncbi:uncharacterized protein LOC121834245 [Ixodes scapularis]|uniref:uncharacterized protein LOC121834245 n=1 Tax=Ixodes scapularis TaxID=6945 RepID=UPI001C38AACB|nr:uncharacterized protein LOC121834245 [Ixodes scapularis]